jgi:hypothetical protein
MTFDPHRVNQEYGELVNDLRELVGKWRAEFDGDEALEQWESATDVAFRECADELEGVLDNHE